MENADNELLKPEMAELTTVSAAYLLKAAKWAKFLAILGFIMTGLLVIAGIIMFFVLNIVNEEMVPLNMPFSPELLSVIYIVVAGIFMIPVFFLNSFANNAIKAVKSSNTEKMTSALKNLKNLFVFIGISTVVILVLYTIILIVVGTAAVFSL